MSLLFITGNNSKFSEAKSIIPELEQLNIDLPEIQELDPHKVIEAKLKEAFKHNGGELIVEDTSLFLDCLSGLPGPFTKWFSKAIGNEGVANLVEKLGNNKAHATVLVGYAKNPEEIEFFEGTANGKIVSPRGKNGFGWDPIFEIEELGKTYAELNQDEKNKISK